MILLENNIIKDSIEDDGGQLHNLYKGNYYYHALQATRNDKFDNFFESSGQSPAYTTLVKWCNIIYTMAWKFALTDALTYKTKSLRKLSVHACSCPFRWLTTFVNHYDGLKSISKMKERRNVYKTK